MNRKISSFILIVSLITSIGLLHASESESALKHANAALQAGQSGDTKLLTKHAGLAMESALTVAITGKGAVEKNMGFASEKLQEAIDHGNLGHAEMASQFVEEAISYIEAAK